MDLKKQGEEENAIDTEKVLFLKQKEETKPSQNWKEKKNQQIQEMKAGKEKEIINKEEKTKPKTEANFIKDSSLEPAQKIE